MSLRTSRHFGASPLRMVVIGGAWLLMASGLSACLTPSVAPKRIQYTEYIGGDSEVTPISFDAGSEFDYSYDSNSVEMADGIVRLKDTATPGSGASAQYDDAQPTVYQRSPIQFSQLKDIVETFGPAGCPGGIRYTISMDRMFWFYFDGNQWYPSDGSIVQANSIATLKEGFPLLNSVFATDFYIRAHLNSSGSQPCELDQIVIQGKK